jgi:hypothetical protein
MTHTRLSLSLLIGVAALRVGLSGLVWLARQQSRRARVLIMTQGGATPSRTVHPDGSDALQGAWRLFFSFTHSLSPTAPVCITSHWTTHRTCRMLSNRDRQRQRNLCPDIAKG